MIAENLSAAFSSPGFLVISGFFYSYFGLMTLRSLSYKKENTDNWLIFAVLMNTFVLFLWDNFSKSNQPVMLVVIPIIIIFDLYFLTNDDWWAYLTFFFLTLLDGFCVYGISSAVIALAWGNPWPVGSVEHHRALLTMTFFLGSLIFWAVTHSKAMTVEELSELLHSRSRGKMLFGYICSTSIILLISALLTLTLIYDDTLPERVGLIIHMEQFLKDVLILTGSFIIIMSQVWEEKKRQQLTAIDSELKMERQFRENSQEDTLLRFCFDISLGEIVEGLWFFESAEADFDMDGLSLLENFRTQCIHEDGREHFIALRDLEDYQEKLHMPLHIFEVRLSVSYLLEKMNLAERVKEELQELNKEWIWAKVQVTIVEDEGSGDILCHLSFQNIDEQASQVEELEKEAKTDGLTGLYNRAAIQNSMKRLFETEEVCGALFMIDMDFFKSVNDTLGHPVGDEVLKDTADILRSVFRGRDIIARLGGDEFCVFAPDFTDEELVKGRAEELNIRGRRRNYSEDGSKYVDTSFSIGVAVCEKDWDGSYEELYGRADLALYEAKEAGRNTNRLYHPGMEE